MSYILNALRKAEQERQVGKNSTWLDQSTPEHIVGKKSPRFWLLSALILVNLATLSFFIWFNLPNSPSSPELMQKTTEILAGSDSEGDQIPMDEEGPENVNEEIVAKPSIQTLSKKNIRESFAETVKARKLAKEKGIQISKRQKSLIPADKQTDKSATVQKKQSINPLDTTPEPLPEEDIKVESLILVDKTNTGDEKQEQAYIPTLKELPLDFRRRVPGININVYVYSEDDAERFVVIDMVKYSTGDMIVDNMELKEIRSDSLVVEYKSETFRITRP